MSSQPQPSGERIWDVIVTPFRVTLHLQDGRSVGAPLSWFPRLSDGTEAQRHNWRVEPEGQSVVWPELGEGLSTADLLGDRAGPVRSRPRVDG